MFLVQIYSKGGIPQFSDSAKYRFSFYNEIDFERLVRNGELKFDSEDTLILKEK